MSDDFWVNKRYVGSSNTADEEFFAVKFVAMIGLCLYVSLNACTSPEPVNVTIYAASSLTEGFQTLQDEFEKQHPEFKVRLVFGGSQVLRLQISNGAPADIFASANRSHIRELTEQKLVKSESAFATNRLAIVLSPQRASEQLVFSDLNKIPRLVLGSLDSPIGQYTEQLFANAQATHGTSFIKQIRRNVVSREKNVRLVRTKVRLGVADAAIIYSSDVIHERDTGVITIPTHLCPSIEYVAARLNDKTPVRLWFDFLRTPKAQHILRAAGFDGQS
ncbi:MAG: molybdate ABC transporter substrate-binding protein [Bradymonadia bacterium]